MWGLAEISPPAVEALVRRIQTIYGDRYECAFSEPAAAESKQSTAMIWKSSTLTGEKVEWPEAIEKLLHQRSDDPDLVVEAVNGKIFDWYPGLFRFKTVKPLPAYEFFVVPLHLKAIDEGSLRRRLAARILARSVEQISLETKLDVILGGDMNAPLSSGDFTAISDASFNVLGAEDEAGGAFTYVKSPKSAIDNIFLSPSMRQTVGVADYFIVAKDRSMPNYQEISDHRPVAVRLSLSKRGATSGLRDPKYLDTIIDALIEQRTQPTNKKRRKAKV
ncbi:hypothetical protein HFO33_32580 [Rhizobium leguminosarum]|nr:endonuclease/exonuclease/phosphatase family protein [Rhizobium leguminosarum]MBY5721241.1 hypothetical protein [Rhizobium leguminosarum]